VFFLETKVKTTFYLLSWKKQPNKWRILSLDPTPHNKEKKQEEMLTHSTHAESRDNI
jgi:hypothetical protein